MPGRKKQMSEEMKKMRKGKKKSRNGEEIKK